MNAFSGVPGYLTLPRRFDRATTPKCEPCVVANPIGSCETEENMGCRYHVDDPVLGPRKHREKVRQELRDYILTTLGAPTIYLELDEQQVDKCIDETLDIIEDYAPREYFDYYTFTTIPGKSVYKMPDDIGVIRNVFYRQQPNWTAAASELGGSLPIEYYYPGGATANYRGGMIDPVQPIWGKMGEWVGYKMYEQLYARTASRIGGWEWVSDMGYIKLYPVPCGCSQVMVHYLQKCKDFRKVTQAMREGALAMTMIVLGNIRGRIQNPVGPGGGLQLDGDLMRDKGYELKEKWEENLLYKYGDLPMISMG